MTPTDKAKTIINRLGMKYKVVAMAMGIAEQSLKNKLSSKDVNKITQNNLEDLISFLKKEMKEIEKII